MKINLPYPPKNNVIREIAKFEMYSIFFHRNSSKPWKYIKMKKLKLSIKKCHEKDGDRKSHKLLCYISCKVYSCYIIFAMIK